MHHYLPHDAILGATSAVVGHGGLSTVMAALAHGVPLVCLPQGRDQGINAERVQACGAGICLPPESAAGEIAEAVAEVLRNPAYTESAQSISSSITRLGAGHAAVEHLTDLARLDRRTPAGAEKPI